MSQGNGIVPFPIRDSSDLKRAIRFAMKDEHVEARSFVASRAKAFGRNDLIPSTWTNRQHPMKTLSIDEDFERIARDTGISSAKLKTVYLRGVDEFSSGDYAVGTPSLYALVRVQKFVTALKKCEAPQQDKDLITGYDEIVPVPSGLEFSVDNAYFMNAFISGDVLAIQDLFKPGIVRDIAMQEDRVTVSGELDGYEWDCEFDVITQSIEQVRLSVQ